jgi:hypothetical protein
MGRERVEQRDDGIEDLFEPQRELHRERLLAARRPR